MNYATIKSYDIANGPGVRVSLFVSGCEHYCKGCFNSEAWDFNYGSEYNSEIDGLLFSHIDHDYIKGLTILGGEPMHPKNQSQVLEIVRQFKHKFPEKDLWIYSGYLYEDLIDCKVGKYSMDILAYTDVLVDGKFDLDLKDIGLNFRGSSNQRIIDVQQSIVKNNVVLHPLGIGDTNRYKGEKSNV